MLVQSLKERLGAQKRKTPKYTQNALNKLRSPKRAILENKQWTSMLTLEMPGWELEETLWDYPEKEQIDCGKEGCTKNWWNCAGAKIWSTRSTKMELKNKLRETYSKETKMRLRLCGNAKVNKDYNCKQNTLGKQTNCFWTAWFPQRIQNQKRNKLNCFEQKVCKQNLKNNQTGLEIT